MINFDALDFSEHRSEVTSFFWRSVYLAEPAKTPMFKKIIPVQWPLANIQDCHYALAAREVWFFFLHFKDHANYKFHHKILIDLVYLSKIWLKITTLFWAEQKFS